MFERKNSICSPIVSFSLFLGWALDFSSVILLTRCGLAAPWAVMEVGQDNGVLPFCFKAIAWTNALLSEFQVNNREQILVNLNQTKTAFMQAN